MIFSSNEPKLLLKKSTYMPKFPQNLGFLKLTSKKKCQSYLDIENNSSLPVIQEELFSISKKGQSPLYLSFRKSNFSSVNKLELTNENNIRIRSFRFPAEQEGTNSFLKDNVTKYYTSYSKLSEIKLLTIGIASPLRILQWSEKTLPNGKIYGEVLNANTLHHKTFKPQKGGLFCERIFGPLKDFECACGKTDKSIKKLKNTLKNENEVTKRIFQKTNDLNTQGTTLNETNPSSSVEFRKNVNVNQTTNPDLKVSRKFCPDCDVEYTWSVIRRYQIGYIKLSSPITHIWFLKGTPSYLSLLLDMKKRYLQFVTYCSETLTIEKSYLPFYSNQESYLGNFFQTSNINKTTENSLNSLNNTHFQTNLIKSENLIQTSSLLKSNKEKRVQKFVCIPKKGWHLDKNVIKKEKEKEKQLLDDFKVLQHKNLLISSIPLVPFSFSQRESTVEKRIETKNQTMPFIVMSKKSLSEDSLSLLKDSKRINKNIYICKHPFEKVTQKKIFLVSILLLKIYSKYLENFLLGFRFPFGNSSLNFTAAQRESHKSLSLTRIPSTIPSTIPIPSVASHASHASHASQGTVASQGSGVPPSASENSHFSNSLPFFNQKNEKLNTIKVPNLKKTFKKLPLDLYILSSLEMMLHKPSISLAIQTTWEILYKKSFLKALKKTKTILPTFLNFLTSQNLALRSQRIPDKEIKKLVNLSEFYLTKNYNEFDLNLGIENNLRVNRIKVNSLALKNLKTKYTNHILNYLKKLKSPFLSVYHTTLFSKRNSFLKIQQNISFEIMKLFLKNTRFYEKILSELFIHFFLTDQFLYSYEKKYNIESNLLNKNEKTNKNKEIRNAFPIPSVASHASQGTVAPQGSRTAASLLSSPVKLLDTLDNKSFPNLINNLSNLNNHTKLVDFSTFDILKFNKNKKIKKKSLTTLKTYSKILMLINKNNPSLFERGIRRDEAESESAEMFDSVANVKLNFEIDFYDLNMSKQKKKNKIENFSRKSTNYYKNKIYNNVYTLSHRERWDMDKDWFIFSLFTFGVTEYFDYPISTYKNRLFSLTYSQEYSNLSHFYENLNFAFSLSDTENQPNVNTLSVQNLALESEKQKKDPIKITASFIYSSSFYSGAGIVQQLLNEFDLNEIQKLDKQNRLLLYQINKSILKLKKLVQIFVYDKTSQLKLKEFCKKRDLLIRRTKLVRKMYRKNSSPSSMVLTILPVLPPDLRPIIKMGNQIAASDLNRLYQRVIYRNDRLKKFLKDPATSQSYEMKYAQRLLQEAVDNLLQNGKSGPNSEKDARGRILKSLSDILKGKQGRFRQFLLGKRVDYSGRSVIVVGPKLKLHECGLPFEMAKELYLPFLLKSILNKNYAKTVVGAKTLIQNNPALANELLHEIMRITPILLNRAPTLHRLGIQAFVPKLIEGRAILLHPLVCSAFNADFDGDQMAVHVPITIEARAEAWKLMLSRNNLLAPATGEPLAIPSQDMVLGCYYLTTFSNKSKILRGSGMYFNTLYDIIKLYQGEEQFIDIHAFVWVKWTNLIENGTDQESPLEIRIASTGQWKEITSNYQRTYDSNNMLLNLYMCTTPGRILLNSLIQQLI